MRLDPDGTLVLSQRNLSTLLAKLQGHSPGSACTIVGGSEASGLRVMAERDDMHYGRRDYGAEDERGTSPHAWLPRGHRSVPRWSPKIFGTERLPRLQPQRNRKRRPQLLPLGTAGHSGRMLIPAPSGCYPADYEQRRLRLRSDAVALPSSCYSVRNARSLSRHPR